MPLPFVTCLAFLLLPLFCFLCSGCKTTPAPATNQAQAELLQTNKPATRKETTPKKAHTNEVRVVKHYPKWNPVWWFGNVDRPTPPDWYRPDDPGRQRRWYWRNSLHNFTHYVIGIYDKPFVRVGRYPDRVMAPNGGWNWAVCKYKFLRLPFISYQKGGFKFYCGWRERGNFGMKLNF